MNLVDNVYLIVSLSRTIRTLEDLIKGGRELGQFVGDFTWYMRNLLLVKTSENPEEAIDVSSENLKLLREESEMVDVETLMRYIRIFSDLSSQIRYSTQKRVLVEIALIKLCRPAMERTGSPVWPLYLGIDFWSICLKMPLV